jgi:hypothetical protein
MRFSRWHGVAATRAIFTTKDAKIPARQAETKSRSTSRKDAKAAKKRQNNNTELGELGALARGISESKCFHVPENLRRPRKLSNIVAS